MLNLFAALTLAACGSNEPAPAPDAATTAPATHEKQEAEPPAPAQREDPAPEAATASWDSPGDGIPEIDESESQTTPTGLRIVRTVVGDGPRPERSQKVAVHYHGGLAENGEQFDSSSKRGKPLEFNVGQGRVIKGWDEGLMELTKGSKARLYIPANLGYGASGAGRVIPPNADLVFDVWLVDIGG